MIPLVDCNWHPNLAISDDDPLHVLKSVYVQTRMETFFAARDLERMRQRARTPGMGGLPQGLVAWCDLNPSTMQQLLSRGDTCGLHVSTAAAGHVRMCLDALNCTGRSLDIDVDVAETEPVSQAIADFPDVSVVLDLNEIITKGSKVPPSGWLRALEPFQAIDNVNVKLTGFPGGFDVEAESQGVRLIAEIIDQFGVERVLLASQSVHNKSGVSCSTLWALYAQATESLRAREREKLFRSNAIRVYHL